jgi:hypothetical protein
VLIDLESREHRIWSQNGEDGVLEAIFRAIGVSNRFFVEFGSSDTMECNCRHLLDRGWNGLFMDRNSAHPMVRREHVAAENINGLLAKYGVPLVFDVLSIDIDGNDYWVWKAITCQPRVVVIEYNSHVAWDMRKTIVYEPWFQWNGGDYFGASLRAMKELGDDKGYVLVYCERTGTNAFFIHRDALPPSFVAPPLESVYRPPNYANQGRRHPPDPLCRAMIDPVAHQLPAMPPA